MQKCPDIFELPPKSWTPVHTFGGQFIFCRGFFYAVFLNRVAALSHCVCIPVAVVTGVVVAVVAAVVGAVLAVPEVPDGVTASALLVVSAGVEVAVAPDVVPVVVLARPDTLLAPSVCTIWPRISPLGNAADKIS